uniref:ComX pheromone n=1 Tax=Bacillus mojavensis TaxID=72360 RepID=Q8VQA3_BACMO|nr:pre-ComX [Bacillus mojavensis]ABB51991.1 pre-ComX [Bacillus mojavensis]
MQEIVGYLVKNPEVLDEVMKGRASLLNIDKDPLKSIVDAFGGLQIYTNGNWVPS